VREFQSHEEFKQYFSAQPKELLEQLLREVYKPPHPLDCQMEDVLAADTFFKSFTYKSFRLQGTEVKLFHTKSIDNWVDHCICDIDQELSSLMKERKALVRVKNRANNAQAQWKKDGRTHSEISCDKVFVTLQSCSMQQLGSNGGPTNGEFMAGSIKIITNCLTSQGYLDENGVLVDGGADPVALCLL